MTTLKQFHWFWAWDDEKEEAWLREMAQKGWHFKSVTLPGNYTFEQGEPRDYVFRLDYLIDRKDITNYIQLFQDAGWDYMGEMNAWQYFRKEAGEGEVPEIFSDNESKARKYERIMLFLIILLPIFITALNNLGNSEWEYMNVFGVFWAAWMLFYTYALLRLLHRISQLKKKL